MGGGIKSHAVPLFTCEYMIPYMLFCATCLLIHILHMTATLLKTLQSNLPGTSDRDTVLLESPSDSWTLNCPRKLVWFIKALLPGAGLPYKACFSWLSALNLGPMESFNVFATSCCNSRVSLLGLWNLRHFFLTLPFRGFQTRVCSLPCLFLH